MPSVVETRSTTLTTRFVDGTHGKDLVTHGQIAQVLGARGRTLRDIHAVDVRRIFPDEPGTVLVHGDCGPNNVLLRPGTCEITAVVDWEWAHAGDAIEDLAWCGWIVRTFHPDGVHALHGFFTAYGLRPSWTDQHDAMVARCRQLVDFTEQWHGDGAKTTLRRQQLAAEAWTEQGR